MSQKSLSVEPSRPLSAAVAISAAEKITHRCRPAPEEHLCTCGKIREICVRECVRALWTPP